MGTTAQKSQVRAIATLNDPARRELFELVAAANEPVGRDEAAKLSGLPRTTVAFHLDRLVDAGLLAVEFSKRTGRDGPGSGRPSKLYRSASEELNVSVPERHYDLMGNLLASAIESADESDIPVRDALVANARSLGHDLGEAAESFAELIEFAGYEPQELEGGKIVLTNCPFHRLASSHTEVICNANVALLEGAADGCGERDHVVTFDPASGRCCVSLVRR